MEKTGVQKLAGVVKVLVTVGLVCNLLFLPLVPGLVYLNVESDLEALRAISTGIFMQAGLFFGCCWQALVRIWREPYSAMLAGFLLFCGANTALILWQARKVLDTIVAGAPFQFANARSLHRAAVCFGLISLAALVRLVWALCYYQNFQPVFTYNAFFVPIFATGGLLCLVVSALFRQAAELKEDSDLTI